MGKTVEDLIESREGRQKVIAEFGCVPESILVYDKSVKSIDLIVIAITDLGHTIGSAFAQQVVDRKILPKRHEYCLIFKKE